MEELWKGPRPCFLEEPSEVVLTYRQPPAPEPEPVTLCYQRPLPACMALPAAVPPPVVVPRNNRRSRRRKRLLIALAVLLVLAMMAATGAGLWYVARHGFRLPGDVRDFPGTEDGVPPRGGFYWELEEPEDTSITIPAYPTGGDTRLSLSPAGDLPVLTLKEVYDKATPSVVAVLGQQQLYGSVGTGIIFSQDGYILTNCHVIAGCSRCKVWVTDEYGVDAEYEARVVGYDEDADLAVLKVEAEGLPAAAFGVSDDLQVGDPVYAIGNPLGVELRNTLTDGIVSAINRDVDVDGVKMTLIQTTAALNSGNSGGPLINQYGQVIGINTIKMMSEYDTIEGLGFAIPSSLALRWVNELIEFGKIQPQPVLGVTINRIPEAMPDGRSGLLIDDVTPGLSADRAGILPGDYLTAFCGQDIVSYQQLLNLRRDLRVGDVVPVQVWRDGAYEEFTMLMMAE
ncbi:MAG: trypsin-like serine protease [Oscillospiraceae bacterium]|jgi:serine protease Do|nr:trypsin-like serine protease [Oscillospiraceae bacterium]